MKTVRRHIKKLAMFLAILFLFNCCKTYQKQPITISEAIYSNQKVKIKTSDNKQYTFCKLILNNEQLYGITKINSRSAKKLDSYIVNCSVDGKIAKIKLQQNKIFAVYPFNKKKALIGNVLIPIGSTIIVFGVVLLIESNNITYNSIELF